MLNFNADKAMRDYRLDFSLLVVPSHSRLVSTLATPPMSSR